MSSADESTHSMNQDGSGNGEGSEQARIVKNVVQTIMESQADTIARMANEAVRAVMGKTEETLADDVEERIRRKEKRARTKATKTNTSIRERCWKIWKA